MKKSFILAAFFHATLASAQIRVEPVGAISASVGGSAASAAARTPSAGSLTSAGLSSSSPLPSSSLSAAAAPVAAAPFAAAPAAVPLALPVVAAASLPTPAPGAKNTPAAAAPSAAAPSVSLSAGPETKDAAARASNSASDVLANVFPDSADDGYEVQISQPSKFGRLFRHIWPAHTFFRVKQTKAAAADYLPETLKAFPQANPSLLTRIKKGILFSPPVVSFIRRQLANAFESVRGLTDKDLFDQLEVHSAETPAKYNIVIEGSLLTVARLDHGSKAPDWILSKHVLMSGYSNDVRFAGEIWKEADGTVRLSNNSGTYRPSDAQLERAVAYLSAVFPNITFAAYSDPQIVAPAKPAAPTRVPKEVFHKELKRKAIHQKNWGYLAAFLAMGYHRTALAFAAFTALLGAIELLRMRSPAVSAWLARRAGGVMRAKEATQFSGFFFGALGVTVAVSLFGWSVPLVASGILAYVVGDALSPLIGMRFGWKPFTVAGTRRSLDGALASFAAVFLMNMALGFSPLIALGGAAAFSAVDVYPVKPDDNLWIPIAVPAALFLLGLI